MIAAGTHAAVCRSIQFGWTENNKQQIVIGFELIGDTNPDAGQRVTYFGMFDEAAPGKKHGPYDFTMQALRHIGWDGDDLSELPGLGDSGQLNHEVWLVIEHEEYQGKTSAKVKWVNKPGGGQVQLKKPMDERDLKSFAATMKNKLRASAPRPAASAPARQPAPHPNAPGGGRDDVPGW